MFRELFLLFLIDKNTKMKETTRNSLNLHFWTHKQFKSANCHSERKKKKESAKQKEHENKLTKILSILSFTEPERYFAQ